MAVFVCVEKTRNWVFYHPINPIYSPPSSSSSSSSFLLLFPPPSHHHAGKWRKYLSLLAVALKQTSHFPRLNKLVNVRHQTHIRDMTHHHRPPPLSPCSKATALGALEVETRRLEGGTNANRDRLRVQGQRLGEIRQVLAVVEDALAHEIEGKDAVFAVGLRSEGGDDGALLDGGADADVVDAGADEHVVDEEGSNVRLVKVVDEGGVANFEGQDGRVGDVGEAVEVVALRVVGGAEGHVGMGDGQALEAVDALERDGLLEVHLCGLEALDVHQGVALDGDGEGLVPQVPRVEVDEGLVGGTVDLLGDVDEGHARLGLGHLERHDGRVRELILEVHDGVEALDDCGDGVGAGDGGVDGHLDGVRLGIGDGDAVDAQDGGVDLVLDNAGEPDEDAGCC